MLMFMLIAHAHGLEVFVIALRRPVVAKIDDFFI